MEIDILQGHKSTKSIISDEIEQRTDTEKETRREKSPAEKSTPQFQLDERKPEEKKPTVKIFGKYDTLEAAEKAYKEAERKIHEATSATAREKREAEARLATLQSELEYYRGRAKNDDEFDEVRFNQALAENPAVAIKSEFDRIRRVEDKQSEERRKNEEIERLKLSIQGNISYMETEYPDFTENKGSFADWMTYYHMDTGRIMADKQKCQEAYRDFLDANRQTETPQPPSEDPVEIDKISQTPPERALPKRPGKGADPRFVPVGQQTARPAREPEADPIQSEIDSLETMEKSMRVGAHAPGDYFR
jgi:hypothetical protein